MTSWLSESAYYKFSANCALIKVHSHELYIYENTYDMYKNFAPPLNGRYLSSNVNITVYDANNDTINVPVGSEFSSLLLSHCSSKILARSVPQVQDPQVSQQVLVTLHIPNLSSEGKA